MGNVGQLAPMARLILHLFVTNSGECRIFRLTGDIRDLTWAENSVVPKLDLKPGYCCLAGEKLTVIKVLPTVKSR